MSIVSDARKSKPATFCAPSWKTRIPPVGCLRRRETTRLGTTVPQRSTQPGQATAECLLVRVPASLSARD
eukprot:3791274-Prymnesium_polylepis.1